MSQPRAPVTLEFHVSRAARDRYGLDAPWFSLTGNVLLADLATTRRLAYRMNQVRDAARHPERAVPAGELHAMGLIDEILHYVVKLYREQRKPDAMAHALETLERRMGKPELEATLGRFTELFPPLAVYRGEVELGAHLAGSTAGVPHREVALEELLLLWLANVNPAFGPFRELFDDAALEGTGYSGMASLLAECFAAQPPFGPDHQSLVEMLRSPAIASPHSLSGQLDYIRRRWGHLLGDLLERLLVTLDVIREEEHARFMRFAVWSESRHAPVADFRGLEHEYERFTPDRDWMPHVVLLAKSAYVWLDQLSRQYGRPVRRLDEVPDEALDRLARWGISGLWIIGLWERSPASARIKQLCGNPEAGASAYSLLDYRIADALGGEVAYENLRDRAWRRGLRLASDMVPNHMGIDSRWVIEHPDWFLSLDHSPYPAYTFGGPDLSPDPSIGIFLEDRYYDRTDAAVVFKRVDYRSGETRYIYHGNDGTLMPWNDTAQLDYLKPEVREAAIQTILHVARQFPIIRFDAAMTLAKRHYQRLWFPQPGTGGAIPSRSERGLSRAAFDAAMPVEFWREVVDRVAAEMPDTLLLAEAFWLMEGYFVRTLGMHRVYNSAFMNMLRDEENANYRSVIKNTIEFDPEILKRYVNFMNNPDERTAVDQFGKGDKYFGICTMMVTMPGVPMFGHGQIEGFTERYGMEFRRATQDETPDTGLVERHEHEIFPLLHRRHVFAEARDFRLYDFFTAEGYVNEDVFAYSNRAGEERALVLYHNRFASTAGWIRTSVAQAAPRGNGEEKTLRQSTLAEGLGLTPSPDHFCVFRDHLSGLEYVRGSLELFEHGLYAQLDAYRSHVFVDFREVRHDERHPWARLAQELGGRGVPSADEAMLEIGLRPVIAPLRELMDPALIRALLEARSSLRAERTGAGAGRTAPATKTAAGRRARPGGARGGSIAGDVQARLDDAAERFARLVQAARSREGGTGDPHVAGSQVRAGLTAMLAPSGPLPARIEAAEWGALLAWLFLQALERLKGGAEAGSLSRERLRSWRWHRVLAESFRELGADLAAAEQAVALIELSLAHGREFREWSAARGDLRILVETWLASDDVRRFLQVHEHGGTWWFRQESWEQMLGLLVKTTAIQIAIDPSVTTRERDRQRRACRELARRMVQAARDSGYRLDALLAQVAI